MFVIVSLTGCKENVQNNIHDSNNNGDLVDETVKDNESK